ncbi:MAG: DNA gyrase inhibitor YacG [Alphaproteobacteria bacterium]|nr:DNA gyrase inhibitor YacG [Alphaproteobacteria bacterium]
MDNVIKTHKCPICHKLFSDDKYAPFCSKRCADIDLGRWFNGDYSVPAETLDEMETEELYEALENEYDGKNK